MYRVKALSAVALAVLLVSCGDNSEPTPFAEVEIVNSTNTRVQVFGCPDCGSGGIGIVSAENRPGQTGGTFIGWTVDKPSRLSYSVMVSGRRVRCSLGGAIPTPPSSDERTFKVTYRITTKGECVVDSQGYP